uniref:protein ALP1-like n=1 Tax=Ciona intestinalis TaxID=7719 RepID=UPI000180B151|nr:protein ALP1-like [Ciona intestinalis]|eukprot:XP_026695175.1 protein ALP1-like [Ciona intestinalis]
MPDKEEALKIAARFEKKSHFPRVMGCIDGSHIAVTAPLQRKKDYTNRKDWDSLVLQAVVDDLYCFRNISVKMPGSSHDATVFKNSGLFKNSNKLPKECF